MGNWLIKRKEIFQEFNGFYERKKKELETAADSEMFWERTVAEVSAFRERYPYEFMKAMLYDLLDDLEEQEKRKKKAEERAKARETMWETYAELPPHLEKRLQEMYRLRERKKTDQIFALVYRDVSFNQMIEDLEAYREQLGTAQRLFGA